jgi:hypothetical protein
MTKLNNVLINKNFCRFYIVSDHVPQFLFFKKTSFSTQYTVYKTLKNHLTVMKNMTGFKTSSIPN